jgi:predicted nucleic acid-binding protein
MIAVDTNVFVYAVDARDAQKRAAARVLLRQLAASTSAVLLWQVACELTRQLRYWRDMGEISDRGFRRYLQLVRRLFPLSIPTQAVLDRALDLADRYSLSHWDSLIVAACIEAGVDQLYTEDMGSPRKIDSLQLISPF